MSHWPDFHLSTSPATLEIPDGSLVRGQLVRREASPKTETLRVFPVKQNAFPKTRLCRVRARARVKSVENVGMVTMLINAGIILVECLYRSSIAAFLSVSRQCNCWMFNWRLNHYIIIVFISVTSAKW